MARAERRGTAHDRDAPAQHAAGGAVAGNVKRCQTLRSWHFVRPNCARLFDLRAKNVMLIGAPHSRTDWDPATLILFSSRTRRTVP